MNPRFSILLLKDSISCKLSFETDQLFDRARKMNTFYQNGWSKEDVANILSVLQDYVDEYDIPKESDVMIEYG